MTQPKVAVCFEGRMPFQHLDQSRGRGAGTKVGVITKETNAIFTASKGSDCQQLLTGP